MLESYTITEIDQLKAMSHPSRVRILQNLQSKEMTAKQLADMFEEEPAKTSYHVKQLLRVGLVRLVRERTTQNGIIEKYYAAIAKEIKTDPSLMGGVESLTKGAGELATTLARSQSEFLRARQQPGETHHGLYPIDSTRLDSFLLELSALTDKYQVQAGPATSFSFLAYPQPATDAAGPGADLDETRRGSTFA